MKTRTKALLLALCAVLLVAASVLGTIAYLTDKDSVTNTFTVGNVKINLDEADITKDDGSRTEVGNTYDDIIPGQKYTKDPTVTVLKDSEDCYVRMLVTVTYKDTDSNQDGISDADEVLAKYEYQKWFDFSTDWTANGDPTTVKDTEKGTISRTYEFRYKEIVKDSTTYTVLPALFNTITVPGDLNNAEMATLEGLTIDVVAQAVQATGFDTADAAWSATFDKTAD